MVPLFAVIAMIQIPLRVFVQGQGMLYRKNEAVLIPGDLALARLDRRVTSCSKVSFGGFSLEAQLNPIYHILLVVLLI